MTRRSPALSSPRPWPPACMATSVGTSLRPNSPVIRCARPAPSGEVDERHVQKQIGHASADMIRKSQRRRDGFRFNLTKAAGL